MSNSQELEVVEAGEVVEIVDEPLELDAAVGKIAAVFSGAADYEPPVSADSVAVTTEIMQQLLSAETEAELWAEPTTWQSKDVVGRTFVFNPNGRIWPSKFTNRDTGRKGAFLSVEAVDEDGQVGIFNTGSPRIAARIAWYARNKGLPKKLTVVERGQSSNGYPILDLALPGA